jgi:DNA-binding winged helix-turn-helix (wHTH) protein/tetratricopeptide (TPR) repeat protein
MYFFAPFRLDPIEERLWKGTLLVPLRRKTFAVLRYLAERPQRLVTQDELLKSLWTDVSVSETVVRGCIRELRRVLGQGFIETAVGRGYRFAAKVTGGTSPAASEGAKARAPNRKPPSLVGRDRELEVLKRMLRIVLEGERRVAFITGEPGIGKTALLDAFLELVTQNGIAVVARGRCIEHHDAGDAYRPVFEALHRLCRLPRGEQAIDILSHHAPTWLVQMPGLVGDDGLDALHRRVQGATPGRMLNELAQALELLSADQAVILAFEDVHWCDPAAVTLMSMLAQRTEPARLLLLATLRSAESFSANHPLRTAVRELATGRRAEVLDLGHLTDLAVDDYVALRFPGHRFPPQLVEVIRNTTGGNPLFMVTVADEIVNRQLVRELDEHWLLTATIDEVAARSPDSLRQLIDIQFDRLSPNEQRILEAAAVAGTEFDTAEIAAALEADLEGTEEYCDALARRGQFLRRMGAAEWPDGSTHTRYAFVHAVFQHVGASRTAPARRQLRHRRIGERLEAAYGPRADEIATKLAAHFEHSHDYAKAAHYHTVAGERAAQRLANSEAIRHFNRGVELLQKLPVSAERREQELRLLMDLTAPLVATRGCGSSELEDVYWRAEAVSQEIADPKQPVIALLGLAVYCLTHAEYQRAAELSERVERLVDPDRDGGILVEAIAVRAGARFYSGELMCASKLFDRVTEMRGERRHRPQSPYSQDAGVGASAVGGWNLWLLGYPERALEAARRALTLAQSLAMPFVETSALNYLAIIHQLRRESDAALEIAGRAIALSNQYGFPYLRAEATVTRCWAATVQRQKADWLMEMEQVVPERLTAPLLTSVLLARMADAYLQTGDLQRGLLAANEGLAFAATRSEHFWEPELHRLKGELLWKDAPAAAEASFLEAIELARDLGAQSLQLRAAMSLSRLWRGTRSQPEALQILAEVSGRFTEGMETADLVEARSLLRAP